MIEKVGTLQSTRTECILPKDAFSALIDGHWLLAQRYLAECHTFINYGVRTPYSTEAWLHSI